MRHPGQTLVFRRQEPMGPEELNDHLGPSPELGRVKLIDAQI